MARSPIRRFALAAAMAAMTPTATAQSGSEAHPVRNDVPVEGREVLVFRHQRLHKGGHEAYFRLSRDGVWPWFEKIGSRIVGQWKVIYPDGSAEDPDFDHGYRLARYASYDHWKATRQGHLLLGGNGPDYERSREALRARSHYSAGSDGAHFLEGVTATTKVYFMPALEESYQAGGEPQSAGPLPVRNDVAWPAPEIVAVDRLKVRKGQAKSVIERGVRDVWPYLEKVGARPIGLWMEIFPPESGFEASPDHDTLFHMVRYAGYEHWKAARPESVATMGGDGRDYEAYRRAQRLLRSVTTARRVMFLQGHMYHSPPKFMPGIREAFRRVP